MRPTLLALTLLSLAFALPAAQACKLDACLERLDALCEPAGCPPACGTPELPCCATWRDCMLVCLEWHCLPCSTSQCLLAFRAPLDVALP